MDLNGSGSGSDLAGNGEQLTMQGASGGAGGMESTPDLTSDVMCRECNQVLYSKVSNASTAQNGKSWRCNICLQFFTVKSSAKRHGEWHFQISK